MDILQLALIFLIVLLGVFLSITGIQVFFILKDLRKALDNLNEVIKTPEAKAKIETQVKKTQRLFRRK